MLLYHIGIRIMSEDENIRDRIDNELTRIIEENITVISRDKIVELIHIFKNLDMDLIPLLDILEYAVHNIQNDKVNSVIMRKILKFYGLGSEVNILKTRQKISFVGNKLIKKPFLKKESIEMINILLQENNII